MPVTWKCLTNIARKRNIKLYETDLTDNIDGFFMTSKGKDFICLNKKLPLYRKSFVLAHELGHYMLHKDCNNHTRVMYHLDGNIKGRIEKEADRFAEELINLLNRRFDNE